MPKVKKKRGYFMKHSNRYLRPWIQRTLEIISVVIFLIVGGVNDFTLIGFFIILGMIAVFAFNVRVLYLYGRYNDSEE